MTLISFDSTAFPWTAASRNLVRFRHHLPCEQLHESFAADFGFRSALSRFSLLKNPDTPPGPDEVFSHLLRDARPLFEKLLGLDIDYPGAKKALQTYSSTNFYRSHVEEFFHHTAPQHQPFPPLRGRCVFYYAATDALRVVYELENPSASDLQLRLRWHSRPSPGLSSHLGCLSIKGGFVA